MLQKKLYRKNHVFVFINTAKSPKDKKKSYYIFLQQKKIQKYVLACILVLITSLLKSWELGQYSKNNKKIILFPFSIWGYDLIRKTYSGY